jgi:hypothetical protein
VFVALTPANGVVFQWREAAGGPSAYVPGSPAAAPHWVKLARTNNTFTAHQSSDGINWIDVGSPVAIAMSSNTFVGLAVSAVNDGALNTSTFDFVRISNTATADSDSDGMPDSFEVTYGFDRFDANDAALDADGDRMTNLHEFLAGTHPRNVNSALRITRIHRISNDVVMSFLAGTGKTYIVEHGTNIPFLSWMPVTNVNSGTNTLLTITNIGRATAPREYYRLQLGP